MIEHCKKICIVGGGTSAWLTAAYFVKNTNFDITLIDKSSPDSIGVGEAVILGFSDFLKECGFNFEEWFIAADATFKAGIFFENWGQNNEDIWHPFLLNPRVKDNLYMQDVWECCQDLKKSKFGLPLYDISITHNKVDISNINSYAFHIDCKLLLNFLQEKIQDKIKFIPKKVIDKVSENGKIKQIILEDNTPVKADLFIDCTGFSSILGNTPCVDLTDRLFVNAAVTGQIAYNNKHKEMRPYTKSIATDFGWIWEIPTFSRIGSGAVFNRNINSKEEIINSLTKHWEGRLSRENCRYLEWSPFYSLQPWKDNVIKIGLSAGFIEPLESTSIAMIIGQIKNLSTLLKGNYYTKNDQNIFNNIFIETFEDCVDFVSMHYSSKYIQTEFWNFVAEQYEPTEKIQLIKKMLSIESLDVLNKKDFLVFSGNNWTAWMSQLGYKVGSKKLLSKDTAEKILMSYQKGVEEYRSSWSIDHATEVERIRQYNYYKKENLL